MANKSTFETSVDEAISLSERLKPVYLQNFKASLNAVAPGAADQIASNLSSMLKGELPEGVLKQIQQYAAEANIAQGRFGQAASFRTARDIGATTFSLMNQAASLTKSLAADMPNISALISSSMAGAQYDTNVELEKQRTALENKKLDMATVMDLSRMDLQKYGMDLQSKQFEAQLAQNLTLNREKSAMEKFQLTLAAAQQDKTRAEQARQFNVNHKWNQQVSKWNREFEGYAQGLAAQRIAQSNAGMQSASAMLQSKLDSARDDIRRIERDSSRALGMRAEDQAEYQALQAKVYDLQQQQQQQQYQPPPQQPQPAPKPQQPAPQEEGMSDADFGREMFGDSYDALSNFSKPSESDWMWSSED